MKLINTDLVHKVRELATTYKKDKAETIAEFMNYANNRMYRDDLLNMNSGVPYHVLDGLASQHYEQSYKIFERYMRMKHK